MIKTIQNWLDVRKQYKLEQQRQEVERVAKVIISDIMRELVKYDIECKFYIVKIFNDKKFILQWNDKNIKFIIVRYLEIFQEDNKIATYEHLKWYQLFTKKSTKKKFYHAEDAVKAISNMIIMGEAI
jgi:hypothetical protein